MKKNRLVSAAERILPVHIAIIMDGNGRWAKRRGLPRTAGHSAGSRTFKAIARYCNKIGIPYLTVYAFSTENWKRPEGEVNSIMNILREYLRDAKNFKEENIQVKFIGDLAKLPQDIQELIVESEEGSRDATGLKLNIALNYGGRDEIIHAVRCIAGDIAAGKAAPETIDDQQLASYLFTAGQPDPDVIIRPSGEQRISNFLLWQSAYAEFFFFDILWPDFKPKHIDMVIDRFSKRDRRFGGV